jgi:hypothetical protein
LGAVCKLSEAEKEEKEERERERETNVAMMTNVA